MDPKDIDKWDYQIQKKNPEDRLEGITKRFVDPKDVDKYDCQKPSL